jgi:hypothetical protein
MAAKTRSIEVQTSADWAEEEFVREMTLLKRSKQQPAAGGPLRRNSKSFGSFTEIVQRAIAPVPGEGGEFIHIRQDSDFAEPSSPSPRSEDSHDVEVHEHTIEEAREGDWYWW